MGMEEMGALLVRWRMDGAEVRRRMHREPTPRERERWHAVWLLTQGWTPAGWVEPWSGIPTPSSNGPSLCRGQSQGAGF